ncbi:MAG: heme exporter protein CcmB [Actinomycetota bacterium]
MAFFRQSWAILKKDLVLELRTKEMLTSMFLFIVLAMIVFNYAFGSNVQDFTPLAAGMLWVAFVFTSLLGLNRSFVHEKDEECLDGLLLCPVDRPVIFIAKAAGNFVFLSIVEVMAVPIFVIFFMKGVFPNLGWLALTIFLGNLGICGVGTLLATISVNTKARDLMLPILFLPLAVPVLVAATSATNHIFLSQESLVELYVWLRFMAVYDIIFLMVAYATYDFVIGE